MIACTIRCERTPIVETLRGSEGGGLDCVQDMWNPAMERNDVCCRVSVWRIQVGYALSKVIETCFRQFVFLDQGAEQVLALPDEVFQDESFVKIAAFGNILAFLFQTQQPL